MIFSVETGDFLIKKEKNFLKRSFWDYKGADSGSYSVRLNMTGCHCEQSEAISLGDTVGEIASSLRSSQ
jgi:hypothetical protein